MQLNILILMLLFLASSMNKLEAADWKRLVDLSGEWLFTVGDDPQWAQPSTNTDDWDMLSVPKNWDTWYEGYNGYAWYRRSFNISNIPDKQEIILFLGYIDDTDEVFLNGTKIGQTGNFPPNFVTAYYIERQYRVPVKLFKPGNNVITVRVYDEKGKGGIVTGDKIGLYTDQDVNFLEINLSGDWKFTTNYEISFQKTSFDDQNWDTVYVPACWDSQGYAAYDGYAYYRKHFTLPLEYPRNGNYMVLGKIDDIDRVYLNGKLIGKVENLQDYSWFNRNNSYRLFRIYKIPDDLLKTNNIIAVEVLDNMGAGGIYEGPVGIMSHDRMLRFKKNIEDETEEDNPLEIIFKFLFR